MEFGELEDVFLEKIRGLEDFAVVESMGRKGRPEEMNYPAAFAVFLSESPVQTNPRPILKRKYSILVANENLVGEEEAAKDTYGLLKKVIDCLIGKQFGPSVGAVEYQGLSIEDYEDGVITFGLFFQVTVYMPIPKRS